MQKSDKFWLKMIKEVIGISQLFRPKAASNQKATLLMTSDSWAPIGRHLRLRALQKKTKVTVLSDTKEQYKELSSIFPDKNFKFQPKNF